MMDLFCLTWHTFAFCFLLFTFCILLALHAPRTRADVLLLTFVCLFTCLLVYFCLLIFRISLPFLNFVCCYINLPYCIQFTNYFHSANALLVILKWSNTMFFCKCKGGINVMAASKVSHIFTSLWRAFRAYFQIESCFTRAWSPRALTSGCGKLLTIHCMC